MRIVVCGATGNVGTSVVDALSRRPEVTEIVGVARRPASRTIPKLTPVVADVARDDLAPVMREADVVINLSWLFQPTRRPAITWHNNVDGAIRVFQAAADAGVQSIMYASSVAAYSPSDDPHRRVDETWPTDEWGAAAYPREKAYVERWLDSFERDHRDVRVVRMRPAFIFKQTSASSQRRIFGGPFVPGSLARFGRLPFVPHIDRLSVQVVHTDDVAEAYSVAAVREVHGAFNLGSEPPIDSDFLAEHFHARPVPVREGMVRRSLDAAWRAHLVPATPGLFDTVMHLPLLDSTRARTELGWQPRDPSLVLSEFAAGLRQGAGQGTAPLRPDTLRGRVEEVGQGIGSRDS